MLVNVPSSSKWLSFTLSCDRRRENGWIKQIREVPMDGLSQQSSIKGMKLTNRFVRSATWEGLADKDGAVTPRLTEMMVELARGEVGLIISSYAFVSPEGKSSPGQLAIFDDRFISGLKDMVKAVHNAGAAIALQIVHGGCFSNAALTGLEIIGPSNGNKEDKTPCRSADKEDIREIISAFSRAAVRAKEAGFDAIQIHAAHGFLLSEFLSPAYNKRHDEYSGSIENRTRILLEVVEKIREEVGSDYPVLVKLNSEDFLEGGMTREEAVQVAMLLEKASVDAIEYSGGTVSSPETFIPPRPGLLKTRQEEVYYRDAAEAYKQKVAIPLILVGGIRSYEAAEEIVISRIADYVALARPLISEPWLIKRWKEGDRRKAECISCNACFGAALGDTGIYCVALAEKRHELRANNK
jgi:2,4-dienoyl-CoA reductase-like NADH-dependent reductase (Old Yellow Enzyme family)